MMAPSTRAATAQGAPPVASLSEAPHLGQVHPGLSGVHPAVTSLKRRQADDLGEFGEGDVLAGRGDEQPLHAEQQRLDVVRAGST